MTTSTPNGRPVGKPTSKPTRAPIHSRLRVMSEDTLGSPSAADTAGLSAEGASGVCQYGERGGLEVGVGRAADIHAADSHQAATDHAVVGA
jgi:hypothetical protein